MMTKYKKLEKRVEELEEAVDAYKNFLWFDLIGTMGELSNENCRFQKELADVKAENEVLKKLVKGEN